jgi:hypothetical protein
MPGYGAYRGRISGRDYGTGAVKGFLPDWKPNRPQAEAGLLPAVQEVLGRYEAQLPLTIRQLFYILSSGEYGFGKTRAFSRMLGDLLNGARRSRTIPFEAIRDDGLAVDGGWLTAEGPGVAGYLDGILSLIRHLGEQDGQGHARIKWEGQKHDQVVWCEAAGMVPAATAGSRAARSVRHRWRRVRLDHGQAPDSEPLRRGRPGRHVLPDRRL